MTQALFKEKVELYERRVAEERKRKLFELWRINAKSFRELPKKYQELLQKKKDLGIRPLRAVPKMVMMEYPEVPFFELKTEEEALEQIEQWGKKGKLRKELEDLEYILSFNTAYNNMRAWCIDFSYTLTKMQYDEHRKRVMSACKQPKKKKKENYELDDCCDSSDKLLSVANQ